MQNLSALSDEQLLDDIQKLLGSERQLLVQHLRYLIEIEDRRLALRAAYSSLFELCTEQLHMSEGQAFRRINAARLGRRFPLVLELIESGAVHLSALVILRDVLTEQNHEELLRQASGKSKHQVQALVAAHFPKPDAPSKIRRVPGRSRAQAESSSSHCRLTDLRRAKHPRRPRRRCARPHRPRSSRCPQRVTKCSSPRAKSSATSSSWHKNRLSHANPSRDLAIVLEQAVDLLLAKLENAKLAKTNRPAKKPRRAKHGAVTRAARRKTFERDGERCAYVDPVTGRRCNARGFLEVDHMAAQGTAVARAGLAGWHSCTGERVDAVVSPRGVAARMSRTSSVATSRQCWRRRRIPRPPKLRSGRASGRRRGYQKRVEAAIAV